MQIIFANGAHHHLAGVDPRVLPRYEQHRPRNY
jgi:hypothetical protein